MGLASPPQQRDTRREDSAPGKRASARVCLSHATVQGGWHGSLAAVGNVGLPLMGLLVLRLRPRGGSAA
jgi:hypothetical protein